VAGPAFSRGKKPRKTKKKKREKASRRKPKVARYLRKQAEAEVLTEEVGERPAPQAMMVDTDLASMHRGGPPRETVGFIHPGVVPSPTEPARNNSFHDLLQQPLALPTGGTAWVQSINWDVNGYDGMANLRVTVVTNDAGTTPIHPGDAYITNADGGTEPITFRRSNTTTQLTSNIAVNNADSLYFDIPGEVRTQELVQCLSDHLTMELTSMAGEPNNAASWNNWCARQRLLTSASSGTFTVTNASTSVTSNAGTYGGIFDADLTTAGTNAWYSTEWVTPEHSFRQELGSRIGPYAKRAMETDAQRIAREEQEVKTAAATKERDRVYRLKEAERRRKKEEAEERARKLLMSLLSPEQRAEMEEKKHFHLTVMDPDGASRRYRIDRGFQGNVKLLGPDGKPARSYCIHSDSRLPYEDQMLAQMLLLEANEGEFLRIANQAVISHAQGDLADGLARVRARHAEQEREERRQAAAP
jgi:hypothetical protein